MTPPRSLSPHFALRLVDLQIRALRQGDVARCRALVAPGTRAAAALPRSEPELREDPAFAALLGHAGWELVGALPLSESAYAVRVRVTPGPSSAPSAAARAAPVDYTWVLRRQAQAPRTGAWLAEDIAPDFDLPL